jgi:predicted Zn-dependent protease
MVFDRVLRTQEERYDAYVRCLGALNIDYSTDRIAFRQMVRAKSVIELFPDHGLAIRIYKVAEERAGPEDGSLIHQMALYEMNRPNGNMHVTGELLARAAQLRPFDSTIKHSQAELKLRFADEARTVLERDKYIAESVRLARECTGRAQADAYGYVTLAKAGLARISAVLEAGEAIAPGELEGAVKDVEQSLVEGLQRYPGDSYLLEAEARLAERLSDSQRVVDALQRAFQANPRSSFIAIRLARCYERSGKSTSARKVLEDALGAIHSVINNCA